MGKQTQDDEVVGPPKKNGSSLNLEFYVSNPNCPLIIRYDIFFFFLQIMLLYSFTTSNFNHDFDVDVHKLNIKNRAFDVSIHEFLVKVMNVYALLSL